MNLFSKKEAAPEPPIDGIAALRRRLAASRNRPGVWQATARDVPGISVGQLEQWVDGRREFSAEILQALVKVVYSGYAKLDEASGMLVPVDQTPPQSMGSPPPPWKRPDDFVVVTTVNGPQPVGPQPKTKTVRLREGFADPGFAITVLDYPPPERRERFVRKRLGPEGD